MSEFKSWAEVDTSCLNNMPGEKVIVPKGDYAMQLIRVKQDVTVKTKRGNVVVHRLTVEIIEGEFTGVEIEHTCWWTEKASKYSQALIATMVISTKTNPQTRRLSDLLKKPFTGFILKDEDKQKSTPSKKVYQNSLWSAKPYVRENATTQKQYKQPPPSPQTSQSSSIPPQQNPPPVQQRQSDPWKRKKPAAEEEGTPQDEEKSVVTTQKELQMDDDPDNIFNQSIPVNDIEGPSHF